MTTLRTEWSQLLLPNLTVLVGELVGARLISPYLYNFTSAGY